MKDLLDRAALSIAVLTPLVIMFAVIHDWAYWTIVDPSMFRTMGIGDHVTSALNALPVVAVILVLYAFVVGLWWAASPSPPWLLGVHRQMNLFVTRNVRPTWIGIWVLAGIIVVVIPFAPNLVVQLMLSVAAFLVCVIAIAAKLGFISASKPASFTVATLAITFAVMFIVSAIALGASFAVVD
jgi:hypothetical protein